MPRTLSSILTLAALSACTAPAPARSTLPAVDIPVSVALPAAADGPSGAAAPSPSPTGAPITLERSCALLVSIDIGSDHASLRRRIRELGPVHADVGDLGTEATLDALSGKTTLHGELNFQGGALMSLGWWQRALPEAVAETLYQRALRALTLELGPCVEEPYEDEPHEAEGRTCRWPSGIAISVARIYDGFIVNWGKQ